MRRANGRSPDPSSAFFFGLGLLICYGAIRLGLGGLNEPGPGFIFFWCGLILALLSIVAFVSLRAAPDEAEDGDRQDTIWSKIGLIIACLLAYASVLERLGYVVSTFLLMVIILRIIESKRWYVVASFGLCAAVGSYLLFAVVLKGNLPAGIVGF